MRPPSPRVLAALVALVAACGNSGTPGDVVVALRLEHRVNGASLQNYGLDTPFTNAFGNHFGVSRLVYFVSDVTLTPADGAPVTVSGAHYVDHEDAARRRLEFALPEGAVELDSVSFVMGVPPALNVTGAFPQAPESLMEWPAMMGGGYHHMKFEGRYLNRSGSAVSFNAHAGPLNGADYSFPVTLDASGLALSDADPTLTLVMNLEQWFTAPNTWDLNEYFQPPSFGMMDNAAKQLSLKQNGADVFSLEAP